jgi:hypothetical protein
LPLLLLLPATAAPPPGIADVTDPASRAVIDSVYSKYGEGVDVQLLYMNITAFKLKYPLMDRILDCTAGGMQLPTAEQVASLEVARKKHDLRV